MHLDRARTENELVRDLGVGAPDRDEPENLELATGQAASLELPCRASADSPVDLLTELLESGSGARDERPRTEPAEAAIGVDETIDADVAVARRRKGGAGAELRHRALERRVDLIEQLERSAELAGRVLCASRSRDASPSAWASAASVSALANRAAISESAAAHAFTCSASPRVAKNVAVHRSVGPKW